MSLRPPSLWLLGTLCGLLASACAEETPTEIRFVGLNDGGCAASEVVLFGEVPLQVVSTSDRRLKRVSVFAGTDLEPLEDDSAPFQFQLDTTQSSIPDGDVKLTAVATDADGNTTSTSIVVCVDNLPPNLDIKSPKDGDRVGLEDATLAVTYVAQDQLGVVSVTASLSIPGAVVETNCLTAEETGEGTGGTLEKTCLLEPAAMGAALAPGQVVDAILSVNVRDKAGNEKEDTTILKMGTRILWWVSTQAISREVAVLPDGRVVAGTDAREILIVNEGGTVACSCTLPSPPQGIDQRQLMTGLTPSADGSTVYLATYQTLFAVDISGCSGQSQPCPLKWSTQAPEGFFSSPSLAVSDGASGLGVLFAGRTGIQSVEGQLDAYRLSDGGLVSSLAITTLADEPVVKSAPVLSEDGQTLYIGSPSDALYAVDIAPLAAGQPMVVTWTFDTGENIKSQPLITADRIYIAGSESFVHAVDRTTGTAVAGFVRPESTFGFQSSMAHNPDTDTMYVGSLDANLYAFDADGTARGEYKIGAMAAGTLPVIGPGNLVMAATVNEPGRLYALSSDLARAVWTFLPPQGGEFKASPVIAGDILYIGNTNGYLYALDISTPSS